MANKIMKFINEQFGNVRGTYQDGQVWLIAKDICKALGLKNVGQAISRLEEDELTRIKAFSGGQRREMILVNESGFYHLVFSCHSTNAKEFRRWIAHKVFPALRRAGAALIQKCVYILLLSNKTVKIGMTQDFVRRLRQIERGSGLSVIESFHTEYMDSSLAKRLEKCCQEHFADKRLCGEFFNVSFEEAQTELQRLTA